MYERFYSFTADPFRLSPDHRFCFNHDNFAKAKAYIDYALHRAEGFVMITGKPGTGKTTLVHDLVERLAQQEVKVATLMSTRLGAEDLLRMTAHAFDIDAKAPNKALVLQELLSFLTRQYQCGKRALLVIDEAQDLSAEALEELRLLTNLQQAGQPLLQVVLIGQESLRDLVRSKELEQLQQRLLAAWHLEPLNPQELIGYIQHRLLKAGWRGDPEFKPGVMPSIHQFSGGVPRMINLVCSRLLLHGFLEELHAITPADIQFVLAELQQEELLPFTDNAATPQPAAAQFDWTRLDAGLTARRQPAEVAAPIPPPLNQILQHEDDAHWEADLAAVHTTHPPPHRRWLLVLLLGGIVIGAGTTIYVRESITWQQLFNETLTWAHTALLPAEPAAPVVAPIVLPEVIKPPPVVAFTTQPGVLATTPEIATETQIETQPSTQAIAAASQNALDSMTTSTQVPAAAPLMTTTVSFERNSVEVAPQFASNLAALCAQLRQLPTARLEVIGYSDRYGNQAYNLELSRRRAEAVATYLVAQGVARERLRVDGRGPREQPAGLAGTAANRMVELTVVTE
jgi:general secretion pathway protein A